MTVQADPEPMRSRPLPAVARYALTLALVAFATLAAVLFDQLTQAPNLSLVFVLPVVIAAVSFGWGPALTAAVTGTLAFNYFLIAPRYTLRVESPANVWALVLLLATAALVSAVAAQARRRTEEALHAADQSMALSALARRLVAATDRDAIAQAVTEALQRLFGAPAVVLIDNEAGLALAAASSADPLAPPDLEAARWSLASRLPTRAGAYPVEQAAFDFWPLMTSQRLGAAIGVRLSLLADGRPEGVDRLIDIVSGYLSVALDRERLARQALETRLETESQKLKADLIAAVSHDLKTPLSTILVTLQSLQRFAGQHDEATRAELLALAEKETARLGGLVANLLDMGRLEAGAVVVRQDAFTAADLVTGALERADGALAEHPIVRAPQSRSSVILADRQLAETALTNLLENAGKYAPAGSPIAVRTGAGEAGAWIEIEDEGPGFPEPIEPLFEKFARGVQGDGRAPGTGLGLAIARGFAEAQGGMVQAFNRSDRPGARVRLTLPSAAAHD